MIMFDFGSFQWGPFRTSEKVVFQEKLSVIINISQVRMGCRDLTNFGQIVQIFKCTADKVCAGEKLVKIDELNKTVITLSIICHESYDKRVIELKPVY